MSHKKKFFSVESIDGDPFYVIPKGTTLYRADSSVNGKTYTLSAGPVFFGFDKDNIEKNYGITYKFKTKREMRCIAIDLLTENSPFYKNSPENIKNILRENYGIINNNKRLSESQNDKTLVQYICEKLGLDGYAANNMETELDTFHAEIAICNIDKITPIGTLVTDESKLEQLKLKHKQTMLDKKDKAERAKNKRGRSLITSPVRRMGSLFGSPSSPSSPIAPISMPLFSSSPPSFSTSLFPRTPSPSSSPSPSRKRRGGKHKRSGGTRRKTSRHI